MTTPLRAVVIVDSEPIAREALMRAVEAYGAPCIRGASNIGSALELLTEEVDVVFLEIGTQNDSGIEVLETCFRLERPPVVVAMSNDAQRATMFAAARAGAHLYCEKPLSQASVNSALNSAVTRPPISTSLMRSLFGCMSLREAQKALRGLMFDEAWAMAMGNRRRAARRLGVSRRAVQLILAELGA